MRKYEVQVRKPTWVHPRSDGHTEELLRHLRFPLLWVLEERINEWLPREVDFDEIGQLERLTHLSLDSESLYDIGQLQLEFQQNKVVRLPKLLSPAFTELVATSFLRRPDLHRPTRESIDVNRVAMHNMPIMRLPHLASVNLIQSIVQESIKPSYALGSMYKKHSALGKHVDRPQCVYNVSIMLKSDPIDAAAQWPLFIETPSGTHEVYLNPGDAVLYRGSVDPHWRNATTANFQLGMFWHYVRSDFSDSLE